MRHVRAPRVEPTHCRSISLFGVGSRRAHDRSAIERSTRVDIRVRQRFVSALRGRSTRAPMPKPLYDARANPRRSFESVTGPDRCAARWSSISIADDTLVSLLETSLWCEGRVRLIMRRGGVERRRGGTKRRGGRLVLAWARCGRVGGNCAALRDNRSLEPDADRMVLQICTLGSVRGDNTGYFVTCCLLTCVSSHCRM